MSFQGPRFRVQAPTCGPGGLGGVADGLRAGAKASQLCPKAVEGLLRAGFDSVDYVEVRDAQSLAPTELFDRPVRILAAARLGSTRLIDNIGISPGG